MAKYYLVGCGGIGGWLANALVKTLTKRDELILIDGDKLEKKNLDRQLFSEKDIGVFKSDALFDTLGPGARCKITSEVDYLGEDSGFQFNGRPDNWVLVGADNHPARALALEMADRAGIQLISAANGYEDAEAFYYTPAWQGTAKDPRTYYPELLTDTEDDPLTPPCTGEVLVSSPQLAIANMSAASYAMWLLWFWREKSGALVDESKEVIDTLPVRVSSSAGRVKVMTIGDTNQEEEDVSK